MLMNAEGNPIDLTPIIELARPIANDILERRRQFAEQVLGSDIDLLHFDVYKIAVEEGDHV